MRLSAPIFRLKRQARLLPRQSNQPLNVALDKVARAEGFRTWSQLAAMAADHPRAKETLARLEPGDLVLLGARPLQGKTVLASEIAIEAARVGWRAYYFTLDEPEVMVRARLDDLGADASVVGRQLVIDTSDDICADHVIERVGEVGGGQAFVVIDYLQLLDQRRSNPELSDQVHALRAFTRRTGAIVVVISQIHRSFETAGKTIPELADVRLPNPLDLSIFTKACFIHGGESGCKRWRDGRMRVRSRHEIGA
jgi:replicative DNA helicase